MISQLKVPLDSYAVHAEGGQVYRNVAWLFPNTGPEEPTDFAIKILWELPIESVRVERLTFFTQNTDEL